MPAAAGDPAKGEGFAEISRQVLDAAVITKGNIVTFDANGFAIQGTTTENPNITGRGVALETKTGTPAGGTKIRLQVSGFVYVLAGAAIKPNARLQVDATAGRVGPATAGTAAGTEQNKHLDAEYISHENEEEDATDAADGDIIMVRLR